MFTICSSRRRNFRTVTAIALILWLSSSTLQYSSAQTTLTPINASVSPNVITTLPVEPTPPQDSKVRRSSNECQIPGVVERGAADCDTALYEDNSSISQECRIPLILIHGIHGNRWPKGTAKAGTDDPRSAPYTGYFSSLISKLRARPEFNSKYKIYRFHYKSDKHGVKEIARSLRNRLDDLIRLDPGNFDKKFMIVAHSMGGLVARSYINDFDHDAGEYRSKRAGERTLKLITLGTPHHGTQAANGDARAPLLNLLWQNALGALDKIKWSADGCISCALSTQSPNRGDLLWDNFDRSWSFRPTYFLNPAEKNHLLGNITHQYDNLVYPYWGSIDEGWMINILGKEDVGGLATFIWVQYKADYQSQLLETVGVLLHKIINVDFDGPITSISNDGFVPDKSARFDDHSDPRKRVHCFKTNHQQLQWGVGSKCERSGVIKPLADFLGEDLLQEATTCPRPVVSTSLTLSPGPTYQVGRPINGSFGITNRGTGNLFMKRVVIGGRRAGICPNGQCPDFGPVPANITLRPNESYNYSGTYTPALTGNYTFYVAYENADGKWTMPVEAENGNKNQLSITVTNNLPNVVVSRSLTLTPAAGPFPIGQSVNGTFSITNRGSEALTMRQVLIGGRLGGNCPNNVCPDFSPVTPNITLNPGQTYNYSGRITLSQPGSYTFYVAYQTPDGKWEMPVKPEAGARNQLSVIVQPPGPVLNNASPTSVAANANAQSINLYGLRLSKVIYAQLRLPNGTITYLYIPLNQLIRINDGQTRISAKFLNRGTYHVSVWTAEGRSNEFPIVVF